MERLLLRSFMSRVGRRVQIDPAEADALKAVLMSVIDPTETTAQRILAAATDEVRLFGAERTTVVSVARVAGLTHANVYRYFPSKIALFDVITLGWLKPVESRLTEIADAPDPAQDKLERLIFALVRAYRDRLDAEPKLFDLFVDAFRENRMPARQHRARIRMLFDRVLEEGIAAGAFSIKRRDRALTLLLDALYRFLQPEAIRLDQEVVRRTIEARLGAVTATLLDALVRQPV